MSIYKQAREALQVAFYEREAAGTLHPSSKDSFHGSYDRWSLAIQELFRFPGGKRILDIGAFDGLVCCGLKKMNCSVAAVDWGQPLDNTLWQQMKIEWHNCNVEVDSLPFPDNEFSGVYMGQILEHFTYSPKKPLSEIFRVLKPNGILVVDVPNVGELHNFYRLIRGKNILYDYKKHYIDDEPTFYKGLPFFSNRHHHEFTPTDLRVLAETCGFNVVKIAYIRSRRVGKKGLRRLEVPFSALRDMVPLFRKTLMLTAQKPE
jgi:ubiquinone/menaquinone biosynthesis C-methylase UbiE